MKIQTLSLVTPPGCNAKCPYCVGRMTCKVDAQPDNISNRNNLRKCIDLARLSGVTTAIITGKGEPTLFPLYVEDYIESCRDFPFVELQTNGILLAGSDSPLWESLERWVRMGLTHVAISIAHYDPALNKKIFGKGYNIDVLIKRLHEMGLTVRVNCIMVKDYIDSYAKVYNWDSPSLVSWAKGAGVDQLTIRPVAIPGTSHTGETTFYWTREHLLSVSELQNIKSHINNIGTRILRLSHGAIVYDVHGQNVCLTDCLTEDEDVNEIRQLIFMPDGSIRYSWQHEGAILLR